MSIIGTSLLPAAVMGTFHIHVGHTSTCTRVLGLQVNLVPHNTMQRTTNTYSVCAHLHTLYTPGLVYEIGREQEEEERKGGIEQRGGGGEGKDRS